MILPSLLLALSFGQFSAPKTWFGPEEVRFDVQYAGNPYDPAVNDVKIRFVGNNGVTTEQIAYFDHGSWKTQFAAPLAGKYKATLLHNGKTSKEESIPTELVFDQKAAHGFTHLDKLNVNRLSYDDGSPLFPIGINLAWQGTGQPLEEVVKSMGHAGITWTRFYAGSRDGKNPWWPQDDPFAIRDQLWPKALDKWGSLTTSCDDANVDFEIALFDASDLSTSDERGWIKNPWNEANGGFLKSPGEFFTNAEAKRREKMWIRYAVARWSGDPHLFAWEIWSEYTETKPAPEWIKEMAEYIRSLDGYGHLIATSDTSQMDVADFYSPHLIEDQLPTTLASKVFPNDKPVLIGEFGPVHDQGDHERAFINTSIWQSIRQNRAGAAMYWNWERVENRNYLPLLKLWLTILNQSGIAQHPLGSAIKVMSSIGQADGIRDINWVLLRLRGAENKGPRISWSGMIDANWKITIYNLDTGSIESRIAIAKGAGIQLTSVSGKDVVIWMQVSD